VLTYERYGMEYRWQLAQLLSFSAARIRMIQPQNASRFFRFISATLAEPG